MKSAAPHRTFGARIKANGARLVSAAASLRLTVVCLACCLVLVFIGTLSQVDAGLYEAQSRYFRSFAVWWSPLDSAPALPVFPGGYTLGILLLVNLVAAHAARFSLRPGKLGILIIHSGLIVLILGQIASDMLSEEGTVRLALGETSSYAEDLHEQELAIFEGPRRVATAPLELVSHAKEIRFDRLDLSVRVPAFWPHAQLLSEASDGALPLTVTRGAGANGFYVLPIVQPPDPDERSLPAAAVELVATDGPLGSYILSPLLRVPQTFELDGRELEIALGPKRRYRPYTISLVDLRHDVYTGTEIPRNFSSRVRILNPELGEDREVLISMNHPLRYRGDTYYQYQMESADAVSVLQVVRNPSWLTPYLSCGLVGFGLVVQFMSHLVVFARRRTA